MPWAQKSSLSWIQTLFINIVKTGRIPRHVAFIMDGNRRFAKKNNMAREEGHEKGCDRMFETLQWCSDLGIREVTLYAFSIENFKRSHEELNALMSLIEEKFQKLLDEIDVLMERGVCLKIIGRLSLLSDKLKLLMAKVMLLTKDNNKAKINVALAYTGRDEIVSAISDIIVGVQNGFLTSEDITEDLMNETLQVSTPDLLIRTSGEVRLSDFMIWQASNTCIYFTDVLWPEYTIWHLIMAIIHYQLLSEEKQIFHHEDKHKIFLNYIKDVKLQTLEKYTNIS